MVAHNLDFKIFLLNQDFDLTYLSTMCASFEVGLKFEGDPLMYMYVSKMGNWKNTASNSLWIREHGYFDILSMVMCDDILYALIEEHEYWRIIYYKSVTIKNLRFR